MEYSSGSIKLIHGDCIDYMRSLPDNAFDLAVCDPPYGNANSEFSNSNGGGRFGQRFERYMEQAQRRTARTLLYPPPDRKTSRHRTLSRRNMGRAIQTMRSRGSESPNLGYCTDTRVF